MTRLQRMIGIGTIALISTGAFSLPVAHGETGGTFQAGASHTIIKGYEKDADVLGFRIEGSENSITCENASYNGTMSSEAETIALSPSYEGCHTSGSESTLSIHTNKCQYTFKIGLFALFHNTFQIYCPYTETIEITHPSCTIKIPEQTVEGVSYWTQSINGVDAITLLATIDTLIMRYEGGLCVLLGTTHYHSYLEGSALLAGEDTEGEPVDLVAIGSLD